MKVSRNRVLTRTKKSPRLTVLILLPQTDCSTHRAIRLRNKSLNDWAANNEDTKGSVLMPIARDSRNFETLENHSSSANYVVYVEPGRKFPLWLDNSNVRKGLQNELKNIETTAQNCNDK